MSDTAPSYTLDLEARIRELESENARLAAAAAPATAQRAPGGRWRSVVSAICIVVASILVPVSIVTAWARVQLVEEDAFVSTLAPLVSDAAVQDMVIDETMKAINARVDFQDFTSSVFSGIAGIDGFPPRAAQALTLLEAPAADGLENLVNEAVTRVVESEAFADVWATATRAAHRALTTAATSDGGGLVVRTDEGVGIQLGTIVETVKQRLVDNGVNAAQLIPEIDRVVIVGKGDNLAAIRTAYALATTLGWWLPVLTLVLFGVGIAVARRRSTAVLGTGIGLALGSGALALALSIGDAAMPTVATDLDLSPSGLDVIYEQLVGAMKHTAIVLLVLGIVVAVLGWAMGRSAAATGVRGAVGGLNSTARREIASRGLDTRGFGSWLARYRAVVRVVIAVLAVLWLIALRPLSIGDIFLVVIVAVIVLWLLELLQRRSDELAPASDDPVAADEVVSAEPAPAPVDDEAPDASATPAGASGASSQKSAKG